MPWSAGTFTRTYGSTGWQGDAAAGTPIVADRHDTNDQDLATGINACLNKDGTNSMTANLNMGGFIPSNLGAGTAAAPAICAGNDQDTGMYSPAANVIGFATNGVERVRFTAAGNVGIGTNSPSTTFHLGGSVDQSIQINMNGNAAFCGGVNNTTVLSVNRNPVTGAITDTGKAAAEINLTSTSTNGSITFLTTSTNNTYPTERMRVTPTGSVGIGNNAPNSLLEVGDGTGERIIRINGGSTNSADGAALYIQNGASTTAAFGHYSAIVGGAANLIPTLYSGGETVFYNAGAERMRISGGGEIRIGGNTDNGAYNLQCNGTGVWGAGAYVNGSDERIKEDIAPLGDSLDILQALNPVTFKYKEDWTSDHATQPGFLAQEVEQVLGNQVYKDGIVQTGGQYMGLAYQSFIPLIVKAIQQLSTKLDALTERVEALEA